MFINVVGRKLLKARYANEQPQVGRGMRQNIKSYAYSKLEGYMRQIKVLKPLSFLDYRIYYGVTRSLSTAYIYTKYSVYEVHTYIFLFFLGFSHRCQRVFPRSFSDLRVMLAPFSMHSASTLTCAVRVLFLCVCGYV